MGVALRAPKLKQPLEVAGDSGCRTYAISTVALSFTQETAKPTVPQTGTRACNESGFWSGGFAHRPESGVFAEKTDSHFETLSLVYRLREDGRPKAPGRCLPTPGPTTAALPPGRGPRGARASPRVRAERVGALGRGRWEGFS